MKRLIDMSLKVPAANVKALEAGKRLLIHQGGKGSRKTYGNLDTVMYLSAKHKDENILISVVSETMPHLKRGAMRDFENILHHNDLWPYVQQNKSDSQYKMFGNTIEFFSADSSDKVAGPRRDYLFLNEIYRIPFLVFDQLAGRTARAIICDYNPVSEFYVHSEILPNPEAFNYEFTISTFEDNPFLPEGERLDLEAKRDLAKKSEYWRNWWKVYGEGQIGGLMGTVFTSWTQIDGMPEKFDSEYWGLDFGYSAHPTALLHVRVRGEDMYVDELIYRTGMLNRDIATTMESLGIRKRHDQIFADSAEPKSIQEIYNAGFNIKGAAKGKDSINVGINKIQEYNVHVTKRSLNLIKELRNYAWITDKDGRATNKPVDAWNHLIDGWRYAIEPLYKGTKTVTLI